MLADDAFTNKLDTVPVAAQLDLFDFIHLSTKTPVGSGSVLDALMASVEVQRVLMARAT